MASVQPFESANRQLTFLKLGGSLITDKTSPHTVRPEVLSRLANEIHSAWTESPELSLLLGHGSGSFGHVPARRYGTRQGVDSPEQWRGFAEVWYEAAALNRLVVDALQSAGLPAVALPPSASVIAHDGRVSSWDLTPLRLALQARLLPVVFGDVVFDHHRGGTILSTEDLFSHLVGHLHPRRILLAGLEAGVWADYPACTQLINQISPDTLASISSALSGSHATDVTGGMQTKVLQSLAWVKARPDQEVLIFSGEIPGNIKQALLGNQPGTMIHA